MLALSILILAVVCSVLVLVVFALSAAYWKLQKKTQQNNTKHYLTGLPNRFEMLDALEHLVLKDHRTNVNIALLIIDIDDFNNINNSLGHKIADSLLLHLSEVIDNLAKIYTRYVYQIGSDEFAVILYDFGDDVNIVTGIANDIIHQVEQPINIDGYELHSSCCIGICVYPECADGAEALLKNAGVARDNAKKIGYSSHSFYTKEMSKQSIMRTLIGSDLRAALQRNEFHLQYQPKIELATMRVQGVEALLRWRHPSLGNITPEIFIPAIEDLGLIHSVGKWVIYTACKEISRLHAEGYSDLHIAINISAHQFNKGDIASVVAEAMWETGIAPDKVELELTEAVVMSDTEKSALMLKVLQSMGVQIAVDDFGTGYSSMGQLTKFPISILKIDKCFVHDLHLHPTNLAIVSTMIRMGKQLGFSVVAEGVECREELDLLRQEGCDVIQGFYFSKPLTIQDLRNYLQENNISGVAVSSNTA
jgi:diguanylate cyclase (GGDEF)-like protein